MPQRRKNMMLGLTKVPHGYNTRNASTSLWIRDRKGKRPQPEEDFDLGLAFTVHSADGIDPWRTYFLVWWVVPGEEHWAPFPATVDDPKFPNPAWRRIWKQKYCRDLWPGFVYVEVMTRRNKWTAGTSGGIETVVNEEGEEEKVAEPGTPGAMVHGIESVSRVKIRLPKPNGDKKYMRCGLVKSDESGVVPEGHLGITIELVKLPK